jgi:hypothetical protein
LRSGCVSIDTAGTPIINEAGGFDGSTLGGDRGHIEGLDPGTSDLGGRPRSGVGRVIGHS